MKVRSGFALVAAIFAVATVALSQESKSKSKSTAQAPPDEKAMMEAMAKAATPGDAHKKLEPFVGTFDAKVTMWADPSKPPEQSAGTSENKWVLGDRWVESQFQGTFMGQPFSGIGYTGYDNVTKQYQGSWMDTMSTGIMMTKGTMAGKTMTMSGSMVDPMSGKAQPFREKVTVADNDHHTMEMWGPGPDGKMYKMMEITYERKK
jgi:Protein of unknown function (DUF1579)